MVRGPPTDFHCAKGAAIPLSRRERVPGGRVRGLAFGNETALADRLDTPQLPLYHDPYVNDVTPP